MKLSISKRLSKIAEFVPQGARVADIGCDHGYLGIHLLLNRKASYVVASDLNELPLDSARRNAEKYGVAGDMSFVCADGLQGIEPDSADTLVCAGMGGEVMRNILARAPWVKDGRYTLILSPQSVTGEFRTWLREEGFDAKAEYPVFEDGHYYLILVVRYAGVQTRLTAGERYLSRLMLESGSPDLEGYCEYILSSLQKAISGMEQGKNLNPKLSELIKAQNEILEMRDSYGNCKTDR